MAKKRVLALLSALMLLPQGMAVRAEEDSCALRIYVSENGSDNNDGSESAPFATIDAARKYLRSVNKTNLKKGRIEVIIKEGEYLLGDSILFEDKDSGTEDNPIYYKGEKPDSVKLTHAQDVDSSNFSLVSDDAVLERIPEEARDNVYEVDLKNLGITDYGQVERKEYGKGVAKYFELYFNGNPLSLSRYPNDKFMLTGQVVSDSSSGVTFKYEGDRYKNWTKADQALVYGFWSNGYGDDAMFITNIDQSKGEISTNSRPYFGIKSDRKYYIYNLLEEVDSPGEYFLDRNTGKLYVYPPEDINSAEICISTNRNSFMSFKNAKYITVENLNFEGSCGNAISMEYCKYVDVKFCRVLNIAGTAVTIIGGSDSNIYGCEIYNIGGSGVVSYAGDRQTLAPGNIVVENCHIHKFAQYSKTYTPAVKLDFVGNTIINNVIHDCPHTAIMFGNNDNKILYNEIYDVCQETDDCGAIYGGRTWTSYGNVISNNYIHDVRGPGSQSIAVYCDDMMSGITMENNVLDSVTQAFGIGGGHYNTVNNNLIMNKTKYSKAAMYYDDRGLVAWFGDPYRKDPENHELTKNLKAVPYQSELWREKYPMLEKSLEGDPLEPKGGVVTNNIVSNHKPFEIADKVIENGTVENNYVTDSEIYINRDARGKYSFNDANGVFEEFPDFKVPDIENVGLLEDWPFDYPEQFVYEEKTVEYVKKDAPDIDVTPILENVDKWDSSNAKVTKNGDVIDISEGATGYLGEKFENGKMKFKFAMNDKSSWVGFMLHSSVTNKAPWVDGKSYLIIVKKDSFELQRWYSGAQLMIRTYENVMYPGDDEYINIEFEIVNLENDMGTSLIFRYNGVQVFNYVDTSEEAIMVPGYFVVYNSGTEGAKASLGKYDSDLQREVAANPYGEGTETNEEKNVRVKVNGKFLSFKTQPVIKNNRVYVSGEEFFAGLGAKTFMNTESNTVIAVYNKNRFAAQKGANSVAWGSDILSLSDPVAEYDGVLMIPLGDVAKILGYSVAWDATTTMVTLKSE